MITVPALSDPVRLYDGEILFDVHRDGDPAGTHSVRFERNPEGLRVASRFELSINFLFFRAYRFDYRSEALWQDGNLVSIVAEVDDNGDRFRFDARREGKHLAVRTPERADFLLFPVFPTNHWNAEVLSRKRVLNTLTGLVNEVDIVSKGQERVETENGAVKATWYAYTGGLQTEVWYDAEGRWVKMRFEGRDGSSIDYICRRCQGGPVRKVDKKREN